MRQDWQAFVLEHGRRAPAHHLAAVVGQPIQAVQRVRATGACRPAARRTFGELFPLFHGRPPQDDEWPRPRRGGHGAYEWLAPELARLASLVGTMPVRDIAERLTVRLRQLTGDPQAARSRVSVQIRINAIGLQSGTDLLGGLTTREAAARVGRVSLIHQAIHAGHLQTVRVGTRHVIPRDEFERWLATRQEPPAGWIRLASLRAPLGISSDAKLPEYASLGYIPDVVKVQGVGTARGTWYIAPARARQILADARAGRPRPWYGKPLPGNVRMMWAKWRRRRHRGCRQCAAIWRGRPPGSFDAFSARYVTLTLGQKRHLTTDRSRRRRGSRGWRPRGSVVGRMRAAGVTVYEAAQQLQQPSRWIRGWIRVGLFQWGGLERDALGGEALRITPLGMAILRAAAADEAARVDAGHWIGVHLAAQHVGACITTVHRWRRRALVTTKQGPRGILFERTSLERHAVDYWAWACRRFKRATPPAWLAHDSATGQRAASNF